MKSLQGEKDLDDLEGSDQTREGGGRGGRRAEGEDQSGPHTVSGCVCEGRWVVLPKVQL